MSEKSQSKKLYHFETGEFCVQVAHNASAAPDEIAAMVITAIKAAVPDNSVADKLEKYRRDAFRSEKTIRIIPLSKNEGSQVSLLTTFVPGVQDDELIQFVNEFREHWNEPKDVTIQALTPNWYVGG